MLGGAAIAMPRGAGSADGVDTWPGRMTAQYWRSVQGVGGLPGRDRCGGGGVFYPSACAERFVGRDTNGNARVTGVPCTWAGWDLDTGQGVLLGWFTYGSPDDWGQKGARHAG